MSEIGRSIYHRVLPAVSGTLSNVAIVRTNDRSIFNLSIGIQADFRDNDCSVTNMRREMWNAFKSVINSRRCPSAQIRRTTHVARRSEAIFRKSGISYGLYRLLGAARKTPIRVGYRTVSCFTTAHTRVPSNCGCLHQCCYRTCPRKRVTACSRALHGLRLTPPFPPVFGFANWLVESRAEAIA